jgi:mannose-6-phosphate isomerase-like protein (cupin superfamily)
VRRLADIDHLWVAHSDLVEACGPNAAAPTGAMSVALVRALPGSPPIDAHHHLASTEVYLVVAGEAEMTVNGERVAVTSGSVVLLEPGDVHTIRPIGEVELRYWAISSPPWCPADHILDEVSNEHAGK